MFPNGKTKRPEQQQRALVGGPAAIKGRTSEWVVDSGCTSHFCKNLDLFVQFQRHDGFLNSAASALRIVAMGTVRFSIEGTQGITRVMELKDVFYVPKLGNNLFSVVKAQLNMVNDGLPTVFKGKYCVLSHE